MSRYLVSTAIPTSGHASTEDHSMSVVLIPLVALLIGAIARAGLQSNFVENYIPFLKFLPFTVVILAAGIITDVISRSTPEYTTFDLAVSIWATINGDLMLLIFLPPLLYCSASSFSWFEFKHVVYPSMMLAWPSAIITGVLTGVFVYYVFWNYELGWYASFTFGWMLCSTDPVAVVALLKSAGCPAQLSAVVEAEALLNDGSAFTLYIIFVNNLMLGQNNSINAIVGVFFQNVLGGPLLGVITGIIAEITMRFCGYDSLASITLSFALPYLAFWLANEVFFVSAVLAVCCLGLYLSYRDAHIFFSADGVFLYRWFWQILEFWANSMVFFLSGIIISEFLFYQSIVQVSDIWRIAALYIGLHVFRFISILCVQPFLHLTNQAFSWAEMAVLVHGGLRGAVSLTLALIVFQDSAIPILTSNCFVIYASAIVVLTLTLNALTMKLTLKYFGLLDVDESSKTRQHFIQIRLKTTIDQSLALLQANRFYQGADWRKIEKLIDGDQLVMLLDKNDTLKDLSLEISELDAVSDLSVPLDNKVSHESLVRLDACCRMFVDRCLAKFRTRYLRDNVMSANAYSILVQAALHHLEEPMIHTVDFWHPHGLGSYLYLHRNPLSFLNQKQGCGKYCEVPRRLAKSVATRFLADNFSLGFEIATNYVLTFEAVIDDLHGRIVSDDNALVNAARRLTNTVIADGRRSILKATKALDALESCSSDVTRVMATKYSALSVLTDLRAKITSFRDVGILSLPDATKLLARVELKIVSLRGYSQPSEFNFLEVMTSIPFIRVALSDEEIANLSSHPQVLRVTYRQGDLVGFMPDKSSVTGVRIVRTDEERYKTPLDGIYIVLKGQVRMSQTYSSGVAEGNQDLGFLADHIDRNYMGRVGTVVGTFNALTGLSSRCVAKVESLYALCLWLPVSYIRSVIYPCLEARVLLVRLAAVELCRFYLTENSIPNFDDINVTFEWLVSLVLNMDVLYSGPRRVLVRDGPCLLLNGTGYVSVPWSSLKSCTESDAPIFSCSITNESGPRQRRGFSVNSNSKSQLRGITDYTGLSPESLRFRVVVTPTIQSVPTKGPCFVTIPPESGLYFYLSPGAHLLTKPKSYSKPISKMSRIVAIVIAMAHSSHMQTFFIKGWRWIRAYIYLKLLDIIVSHECPGDIFFKFVSTYLQESKFLEILKNKGVKSQESSPTPTSDVAGSENPLGNDFVMVRSYSVTSNDNTVDVFGRGNTLDTIHSAFSVHTIAVCAASQCEAPGYPDNSEDFALSRAVTQDDVTTICELTDALDRMSVGDGQPDVFNVPLEPIYEEEDDPRNDINVKKSEEKSHISTLSKDSEVTRLDIESPPSFLSPLMYDVTAEGLSSSSDILGKQGQTIDTEESSLHQSSPHPLSQTSEEEVVKVGFPRLSSSNAHELAIEMSPLEGLHEKKKNLFLNS